MKEEIKEKSDLILGTKIFFYFQLAILFFYSILIFGGENALRNNFLGLLSLIGVLGTTYLLPFLCLGGLVTSIWILVKNVNIKWGILSFVISIISAISLSFLYFAN